MTTIIAVEIDDGPHSWSLQELVMAAAVEAEFIRQCVDAGLADVIGDEAQWRFDALQRQRLLKAWRLHRDLEIHMNALPLVLDLLDEVQSLRQQRDQLLQRLQRWELR